MSNNNNKAKVFTSVIVSHNYRMQCLLRHFKFIESSNKKKNRVQKLRNITAYCYERYNNY
jgi:hypothetical protein